MTDRLDDYASICRMSAALKPALNLSNVWERMTRYLNAGVSLEEMRVFDKEAVRMERIRRDLYSVEAESSKGAQVLPFPARSGATR